MNEGNQLTDIYLQEFTNIATRLHKVWEALENEDIGQAKVLLDAEIHHKNKFWVIQRQVQALYPDFVIKLDQARKEGKITKLLWQIGYCLQLGMSPKEVAWTLATTSRSVSSQGSTLRRMGLLPPSKKSTKPKNKP